MLRQKTQSLPDQDGVLDGSQGDALDDKLVEESHEFGGWHPAEDEAKVGRLRVKVRVVNYAPEGVASQPACHLLEAGIVWQPQLPAEELEGDHIVDEHVLERDPLRLQAVLHLVEERQVVDLEHVLEIPREAREGVEQVPLAAWDAGLGCEVVEGALGRRPELLHPRGARELRGGLEPEQHVQRLLPVRDWRDCDLAHPGPDGQPVGEFLACGIISPWNPHVVPIHSSTGNKVKNLHLEERWLIIVPEGKHLGHSAISFLLMI